MRIERGNYDGASAFAYFDKPVSKMDLEECRWLLEAILHRAMPGSSDYAPMVYGELSIAEDIWKEWVSQRPIRSASGKAA